jgi:TolB-like protein
MAGRYRFGEVEIDVQGFRLLKRGRQVPVEPKALSLLIFLVENRDRLVERQKLLDAVWGGAFVTDHVLNRAIGLLRKLLDDDPKQPHYIETVPTLGYRFIADVAPDAAAGIRPRPASVAVLPFVNLSADPENEFFADGITEDVIAHLAKIRSLKVISRSSVIAFKKRDRNLREIGEKLGAATLLDGSVRRAGNRVRIVAQLIEGSTDEHIWADTYDRELTDIFAIQTEIDRDGSRRQLPLLKQFRLIFTNVPRA